MDITEINTEFGLSFRMQMGKMKIRIHCEVQLSSEYENEPEKLQYEINILIVKSRLKAHELQVNLFEKWGEWEYARNLSRDMRMNFIGFGEVLECNSGVFDYEATKKTFKNPLKSLLFFGK